MLHVLYSTIDKSRQEIRRKSYVTLTCVVLMTMTLMTLWLEPRSIERMVVANMNFILHLLCLLDLQWKLPFNGIHPPQLSKFL